MIEFGVRGPLEVLVDELWGEQPPPTAAKLVQVYVSGCASRSSPIGPAVSRVGFS